MPQAAPAGQPAKPANGCRTSLASGYGRTLSVDSLQASPVPSVPPAGGQGTSINAWACACSVLIASTAPVREKPALFCS